MSGPSLPEEQLLELMLQLKKTTADSARAILNSQPAIAYALITLMVNMNAVNVEVLQKTVASFGSLPTPTPTPTPGSIGLQAPPYRISTPPIVPASFAYGNGQQQQQQPAQAVPKAAVPAAANYGPGGYHGQPASFSGYGAQGPQGVSSIPEVLAAIPDEQKAMIMRVISMTMEEINQLAPTERAGIVQLRATLGLV